MADERSEAKRLARLYRKVPAFECIEGCTDCCGRVPWTELELKRAGLSERPPPRADGQCPFALNGGCDIYDARPFMCRLFGTVEDLRCPHGRGPLTPLTVAEGQRLVRKYKLMARE